MQLTHEKHRIYAKSAEGKVLAEVTFPPLSADIVNINHTFVDDSLRGQGIADELLRAVVAQLHEQNLHAHASCSYAKAWFDRHPEQKELLIP